jgi:glutaconate CoA-transferase subunit B
LAVNIARTFKDGEVGFTGLVTGNKTAIFASMIPLAAMSLAQHLQAPNLTILLGGWLHNPNLSKLKSIPDSEFEPSLADLECEAQMIDFPGQWSVCRGDIDCGFSSGAQVDKYGNMNSVCIGDYKSPKVRLVGPIFQTEHMALFRREIIMIPHQEKRNFVEKVDYVSAVGYPGGLAGRKALGLEWGGPEWVVTDKGIFDFDKESGEMRVKYIHPGITAKEVQDATGFQLPNVSETPATPEPTEEELDILRNVVDPRGMLIPRQY